MTTGFRIGQGWDVHALVPGRQLVIGGVHIPYALGLLGHSDADVLLHAIIDALLGAMALGDIGKHFPDTDVQWKNADSKKLLLQVREEMRSRQWQTVNIDATVIAEAPKLSSHIPKMCKQIASILGLDISQVNIKGKTHEKVDALGENRAIACNVVVLLCKTST